MSLQEIGGSSGNVKKSQSSPDSLVEEIPLNTTEETNSGKSLVIRSSRIQWLHETSFVFDDNIEHNHTPKINKRPKNVNNADEETKKLTFRLEPVKNCGLNHTKNFWKSDLH